MNASVVRGLLVCAVVHAATAVRGTEPPSPAGRRFASERVAEQRIHAALAQTLPFQGRDGKPFKFDFRDTPLVELVDQLQVALSVPILIDSKALDDEGIAVDTPVTFSISGVSCAYALERMLLELDLRSFVDREALLITTRTVACEPQDRVYDLSEVFSDFDTLTPDQRLSASRELTDAVVSAVDPHTWGHNGGQGNIARICGGRLWIVTQSYDALERIERLLHQIEWRKLRGSETEWIGPRGTTAIQHPVRSGD